ncbi:hypothetical protein CAPTEDRAFT_187846 [Capitella teleta]|uniref:Uncharacterized protein n=1 Tax=Capitella teleta TaxID=283909 RepID=R7TVU5_CAPTE|nr:hypothetical protein CAPTEDRAFT_187846 [Capitella teleta]|eukprot:ELT97712.1 hypothetical protein CAPTEDRAFT_187846 [Capitella teleta]
MASKNSHRRVKISRMVGRQMANKILALQIKCKGQILWLTPQKNYKVIDYCSILNLKTETCEPISSRLRRLQGLLSTEGSPGKSPDALLCILGIDSWYNDGMKEMADFLLANLFDSRKIEIARSGYEDEEIEDMMFVLRSDRVEVFCNPINYHFLLPYIAHWKNLRIHCLEEKDYDDQDKAEEFKIHSLVAMLHGCERIGIPFNRTDSGQIKPFDKMVIEKWPIIQGFAVEGLGGGGFFTLKYEVFEMSSFLGDIYEAIDPLVLEALITEPLVTYFTHGRTGRGDQQCPGPKPFVLIGDHTCRSSIDSAMKGNITNLKDQCLISDATQPLHMICQAMSPRSSLLACRTYFLKNAFVPQTCFKRASLIRAKETTFFMTSTLCIA